jgi:HK97 gp10 family phage protein
MTTIQVKINGLEDFKDALKRAPVETANQLSKAINKSILTVQNQAMKEAPVNKQTGGGNLRQKIQASMVSKFRGVVEAKAPYSIFVHEGTAPHEIRPVNKSVLANRRTGQFFGKLVHHPGTKPNPFLLRALQNSREKIEEFFTVALTNSLKSMIN